MLCSQHQQEVMLSAVTEICPEPIAQQGQWAALSSKGTVPPPQSTVWKERKDMKPQISNTLKTEKFKMHVQTYFIQYCV